MVADEAAATRDDAALALPLGDLGRQPGLRGGGEVTHRLDDAPALGGALGLGFLGINNSSSSLASQGESTKEGEKKDEGGMQAKGMSVKDLAAALMAELRGLEDRVEVLGEEEGAMVALKLGAALEAVRQEPFKSI